MIHIEYPIAMEIAGNTAMWTRPDTGDCPVSYPAPTYSAVKGLFESVLWLPSVEVVPTRVEICNPIHFHSYHNNYMGPLRKSDALKSGNPYQLMATVLIDVRYKLYAIVRPLKDKSKLPEKALNWDSKTTSPGHAYQEIFNRRLKRGQCYAPLFLGWKEFTPFFFGELCSDTYPLEDMETIVIPSMLRQVFSHGYASDYSTVYDTDLRIEKGVLKYPERRTAYDQ